MKKLLRYFVKMSLVMAVVLLMPLLPALAASIAVDGTTCTLPNAITAANTDTATSGCTAGSGDDTLNLGSSLSITLTAALPTVTTTITIEGNSSTIDGDDSYRILHLNSSSATLTVKNLIFQDGSADKGGAIYREAGSLTITSSTFNRNTSTNGGGGAVYWDQGAGTLSITGSRFTNNSATASGDTAGALSVNTTSNTGTNTSTITNSYFSGNSADSGGGAMDAWGYGTRNGSLTITNSTIAGNASNTYAGGIDLWGGGPVTLRHVTLVNNNNIGGISMGGGITISGSLDMHISNSIIYGNTVFGTAPIDCAGETLETNVGNLGLSNGDCGTASVTSDPKLGTLRGSYYPLGSDSPAIDAVDCLTGITTDQRGNTRPSDGNGMDDNSDGVDTDECDIGAIEAYAVNAAITVDSADDNTTSGDSECTLREAIENANNADQGNSDCGRGGSGINTINVDADLSITLGSTLPAITSDLTINGNGLTLDGDSSVRLISVSGSGSLAINEATLQNASISSGNGAAILFDSSGTLTIKKSAFINNSASGGQSGAIHIAQGTVNLVNSTLSGSSANSKGMAITVAGGGATLQHITIAESSDGGSATAALLIEDSGSATLQNSLLADNAVADCSGALQGTSLGNLIENGINNCSGNVSGDPLLAALSGGVHGLLPGSAAVDAVDCLAGIMEDQRGEFRRQDGDSLPPAVLGRECDIGAFEARTGTAATPEPTEDPTEEATDEATEEPTEEATAEATEEPTEEATEEPGAGVQAVSVTRKPATPMPTATPKPTKSTGQMVNESGKYQVSAQYGVNSGVQFKELDEGGIGNDEIIKQGYIDAMDVFGYVEQSVEVCFNQLGKVTFLDASKSPRVPEEIESRGTADGKTCVNLNKAGTLVLQEGSPTTTESDESDDETSLSGCMVTTTAVLNFRDGPGGEVIGWVTNNATLTALDRTDDWFKVDNNGTEGWISASYVKTDGTCE